MKITTTFPKSGTGWPAQSTAGLSTGKTSPAEDAAVLVTGSRTSPHRHSGLRKE